MPDPAHPLGPLPTQAPVPSAPPGLPEAIVEHHPDGSRTYELLPILVDERQVARDAVEEARLLAAGHPSDHPSSLELASRLGALGDLEMCALMSGAAAVAHAEALSLRRAALARAPEDPAALKALCGSLHGLANALEDQDRNAEATALFGELITHRRTAVARQPDDDRLTLFLADSLWRVGLFESERHYRYSPAAQAAFAEALGLLDAFVARHGESPLLFSLRGKVLCSLAEDELHEGGHPDQVRQWAAAARVVAEAFAAAAPDEPRAASLLSSVKLIEERLAREVG